MKYVQPKKSASGEILDVLKRTDATPSERIDAVLSAVFYGETVEFSGDVLIGEFAGAEYQEKTSLKNVFGTFYQMRQTAYRIDESICLLERYKQECPESSPEIESAIDELIEFKAMFRGR